MQKTDVDLSAPDCWATRLPSQYPGAFVSESLTRSDETNTFSSRNRCADLADGCAARRGNLLRSKGYAHAPIFVAGSQIDVKQLVLQNDLPNRPVGGDRRPSN